MRLDRTISLYVARPRVKNSPDDANRVLPILMYHSISDDPEPGVSPYYKTCTSPAVFERQMRWLSDSGFSTVGLAKAGQILKGEPGTRGKHVVITFDDGFRDFYSHALPVLAKYGFSATVYLPTAFIGDRRGLFKNRECLTWGEVRESRACGIEFGSHTVNHPVLYKLSWAEIEREMHGSKVEIENRIQAIVSSFAYPYAYPQEDRQFTGRLAESLRAQGYENCVTTMIGCAKADDELLQLKRLPVNDHDDLELFAAKLAGAYDWLAGPQSWFKSVRHRWSRIRRNESAPESCRPLPGPRKTIS